jgi:hypothetical protein
MEMAWNQSVERRPCGPLKELAPCKLLPALFNFRSSGHRQSKLQKRLLGTVVVVLRTAQSVRLKEPGTIFGIVAGMQFCHPAAFHTFAFT